LPTASRSAPASAAHPYRPAGRHTTTLLYAAEYLARTRQFNGTLQLIFQPAEELLYGVQAEDGVAGKLVKQTVLDHYPPTVQ
jgi:metal-dependent amidase/aminoacylase/carboxypeptidase family protein